MFQCFAVIYLDLQVLFFSYITLVKSTRLGYNIFELKVFYSEERELKGGNNICSNSGKKRTINSKRWEMNRRRKRQYLVNVLPGSIEVYKPQLLCYCCFKDTAKISADISLLRVCSYDNAICLKNMFVMFVARINQYIGLWYRPIWF